MSRLLRGVAAGAFGTAVMSLSETLHHALRPRAPRPIDYDVSEHVPMAVARLLHLHPRSGGEERALFLLAHLGYGSAFGVVAEALAWTPTTSARQTFAFFAATEGLALVLFPLLGGTPPPWRWRGEVLAAGLLQHAVYAVAVSSARRR